MARSNSKKPLYRVPFLQHDGSHNGYYTRKPEDIQFAAIGIESDRGGHKIWAVADTAELAMKRGTRIQNAQHGTAFELSEIYIVPRSGEPTIVQQ